jgi:polyisoprenoid-binding protein YceI
MKNLIKTIASVIALSATALMTSQAQAQSATYAIDPTHTFINFEVKHFGTSTNRGRWDKKEGSITQLIVLLKRAKRKSLSTWHRSAPAQDHSMAT